MLGALGRWFKAVAYLLTGRIDAARRTLDQNPNVVRAKYDDIIRDKTSRIQQYKQAVAGLIAQQENKMSKVKSLTEDVQRLERLKEGALAKAKKQVAQLQAAGKGKDNIQEDEDYSKCLGAFNDFSTTLGEKQARIEELEGDIGEYGKRISDHKVQLQELLRDVEKIKSESADAVADVITATQEREVADMLSGIAQDGTAAELQRLRETRQRMKAEARISKEMAGTDTKAQEAEFLDYARKSASNSEFDALVGLAEAKDEAPAVEEKKAEAEGAAPLPE